MSAKVLDDFFQYVNDIRRHTSGRHALHIKMSVLENQFRQPHYKQQVGAAIKSFIDKHQGKNFVFDNADLVLISGDVPLGAFSNLVTALSVTLKESAIISSLDPTLGVSDVFIEWFDLALDYDRFTAYTVELAAIVRGEKQADGSAKAPSDATKEAIGLLAKKAAERGAGGLKRPDMGDAPRSVKMSRGTYVRKVAPVRKEQQVKELDPEMLLRLSNAINGADMGNFVRCRNVLASLPGAASKHIMSHWYIPIASVLDAFLGDTKLEIDPWLYRYLEEKLTSRLLDHKPKIVSQGAMLSSIRVSSGACLGDSFAAFDEHIGNANRKEIVLEFSIHEVLQAQSRFLSAQSHVTELGYLTAIADIDIRILPWMAVKQLSAQFLKVNMPQGPVNDWLNSSLEKHLPKAIQNAGLARVILSRVNQLPQKDFGQSLGITLFQGDAIEADFQG